MLRFTNISGVNLWWRDWRFVSHCKGLLLSLPFFLWNVVWFLNISVSEICVLKWIAKKSGMHASQLIHGWDQFQYIFLMKIASNGPTSDPKIIPAFSHLKSFWCGSKWFLLNSCSVLNLCMIISFISLAFFLVFIYLLQEK